MHSFCFFIFVKTSNMKKMFLFILTKLAEVLRIKQEKPMSPGLSDYTVVRLIR